jgi:hypothetical protein
MSHTKFPGSLWFPVVQWVHGTLGYLDFGTIGIGDHENLGPWDFVTMGPQERQTGCSEETRTTRRVTCKGG